jgi:lambda family phage tail tape measure protein
MAKSVAELLVQLDIDGIEGVNVLKSSLIALGKAAGPTDKSLRKIRTEILEFANAGQISTQSIRGVIESFKGLQAQASIGSSVYRQLAADVESLEGELKSLTPAAQKAAKAIRAFGPSKVPDAFVEDMKERRRQLQGIAVDSNQYLEKLVAIKNFEAQQAARVGRQEVSAAARVARTGIYSNIVESSQPATLAALRLRIGEVQNEIENLDFTTTDYADANKELIALQKSLSEALGGTSSSFDKLGEAQARAARRAKKLVGIKLAGIPGDQPAIGTRDPRTGAMIAGGKAPALSTQKFKAPEIKQISRSYEEVANNIRKVSVASNGSVRSLETQRNSWSSLRAGLDPASESYRQTGREIDRVEKKLSKLNKTSGSKAKNAARGAGAVISGGMFGGPEGALGALSGFALGGVEGAIGGGFIGSQVREIRRAIGATAEYSAKVQKLEIGLRGVVSSESEFHQAIAVANSATKDFNITAIDSISGVTKLSAAVIGAGGNLTDVEIVFRGISSAVLATGGSADDVRSAITAMVQVFSKGKVSAEELSGQLGERLPGAVVRFAKAAFGTGPEAMQKLQKELKNGTVGLNELMLFAEDSGLEFEELAKKIASSSASAGARLNILADAFRLELGTAIQPIGAQIQDFTGEVLVEFKDEIIAVVKELGKLVLGLLSLAKFVADNKEIIGFFAGLALKIKAAQLAIAAFAGIKASFAGVVAAGTSAKITGDVAQTSAGKVTMLKSALKGLAAIGIVTVGIDIFMRGMSEFAKAKAEIEKYQGIQKDPSAQFKGKTKAEVEAAQADARKLLPGLKADLSESQRLKPVDIVRGFAGPLAQILTGKSQQTASLEAPRLSNKIKALERTLAVDSSKFAVKKKKTKYDPLNPDDTEKDTGKKGISDAMMEARINGMRRVITLEDVELKLKNDLLQINLKELEANEEIVAKAQAHFNAEQSRLGIEQQLQALQENIAAQVDKARLASGQITQEQFNQNELQRRRVELERELFPLLLAKKLTEKEVAEIIETIVNATKEGQNKTKSFVDGLKELIKEATNLNATLAEFGVQAIDKFANTFADFVATGKASFREFANSVLADLARIFARAAFFQALEAVFPGLGKTANIATSANGNVLAKNKIVPYAYGGIVNKPTLFPMANGAGLMGEAGPEAIMPLRRGANGKLGVEASGSGVGGVVVNVDAAGSSVEGDGNQAAQLGKAIGIAVQQELVKQKRPGGLLSR